MGPPPLLRGSRDTGEVSLDPEQGRGAGEGETLRARGQHRQRKDSGMPAAGCLAGRREGHHILHRLLDFGRASDGP